MELRDLLSILEQDARIAIKTEDSIKPFRIEWTYVEDVPIYLAEWLTAFVSGVTMDSDGEYVITIVPED